MQKIQSSTFGTLIATGNDTERFEPTLFDFLSKRKIQILKHFDNETTVALSDSNLFAEAPVFVQDTPKATSHTLRTKIMDVYRSLLNFHETNKNIEAYIYTDLQRLSYAFEITNNTEAYSTALQALEAKYTEHEMLIEILHAQANLELQTNTLNSNKIAHAICQKGISKFPTYRRISILKNTVEQITHKKLHVTHPNLALASSQLKVNVESSNIHEIKIEVYRINETAIAYFQYNQNRENLNSTTENNKAHPNRTRVWQQVATLAFNNFNATDTTFVIKTGSFGIYEITISEPNTTNSHHISNTHFSVSNIGYLKRTSNQNSSDLYTLNRKTGLPLSGSTIRTYQPKWNGKTYELKHTKNYTTDKTGKCKLNHATTHEQNIYFIENGQDKYFNSSSSSYFHEQPELVSENAHIELFTDRSLYRPGQIVYFKAISYFKNKNRNTVDAHSLYEVTLYDANQQHISSKKLKTNEMGSFAGEFVLPPSGLNGAYHLKAGNAWHSIYVEEYKRPSFEVTIEKPKNEVKFGSKVEINATATAYAGYKIAGAQVQYRISRSTHRFSWWHFESPKLIGTGTTTTNENGNFKIHFTPEKSPSVNNNWRGNLFTYTIEADVTDSRGETQQGEQSFSIGDKALVISAAIDEKVEKSETWMIPIHTETLNGEKTETTLRYDMYLLENSSEYAENTTDFSKLKAKRKVVSGKYDTKNKLLSIATNRLKSGKYRITLYTTDAFGQEVKSEHHVVLFDTKDKRPPIKSYTWLQLLRTTCKPGEKAHIRFGTSTKNTPVLYEIMRGNTVLESKWIRFNNEIKDFEIPFLEKYGSGVNVTFNFMKDEKHFQQTIQLRRKADEKKLNPTLTVFRNKLQPGEKAEWTLTVPEQAIKNNPAEVLISMYDASLDAIRPHAWNFNPQYVEFIPYSPNWTAQATNASTDHIYFNQNPEHVDELNFAHLNWYGLYVQGNPQYINPGIRIRGRSQVKLPEALNRASQQMDDANNVPINQIENLANGESNRKSIAQFNAVSPALKRPTSRTNFNETAFFYPQLRTDAQGQVKFSFTAPESLTRWNLNMLAHTRDLWHGVAAEQQIVTQKQLMVQLHMPRFVRRSDAFILSANVVNLTDSVLKNVTVALEIIDPRTEKLIYSNKANVQQCTTNGILLNPNETKAINFSVPAIQNYELVTCKIIAQTENFGDGEQNYLAVLPDKVLITESMPLTIRNNGSRTFNFESFSNKFSTVETKNLTVEFSSNPTWYAVKALPSLSEPTQSNAIDYFTAYYVNSLAQHIANSNPKLKNTFDQWKLIESNSEALVSNLSKNTELKNMLLDETPWLMAAKNETEQKRQIAFLFDLNKQKNQGELYLEKLLKLQLPDGGFSWFEGMPSNRYITQEILLNIARLRRMTAPNNAISDNDALTAAITNALTYLDLQIARDYAELKKTNNQLETKQNIGDLQLFYLHLRSEYPDFAIRAGALEAVHYFTKQSEKNWKSLSLYGRATVALVAHRNGKIQLAQAILKSLRENAIKSDEFGMHWARNTAGYYWNEQAIAIQATIIEAFSLIANNSTAKNNELDEMKIGLLKQKQTQRWSPSMNSVNAIYALLMQGSNWLANESQVAIRLGNTTLKPTSTETGTGYLKKTMPAADVKADMGKVTVQSNNLQNHRISWGAVYWQYYQDLHKVQSHSNALKISKKLFVESNNKKGSNPTQNRIPIEQTQLKKGDKIVTRLVISTDRNLEFVVLKDLRAACLEPTVQRSGYVWREGTGYYKTTKDASTQFFFNYLPKGTYVFEYEAWINSSGTFTSGIASVQCQYAPEFTAHAGGEQFTVW